MSNKSSGDGTLFQRKDGRWQASIQLDGMRRTVYGKTEREARTKLRDLQRQADSAGSLPAPGKRTVNDLLDAWLSNASNLKPSTVSRYRWFLDTAVRPAIGEVRLERLTPDRLQQLYTDLTPSVGERVHRLLHRAFTVAVLWRWLPANPCDRVLKPAYKSERQTLWTQAELTSFLEHTTDHWLHPLWVLLAATGCRVGEALALRWSDVALESEIITVSQTLSRIDGEWVTDSPKTASSARTIALPSIAIDALQRQQHQQETWKETCGAAWEEWGFAFTGKTGKPLFASTVQHALKRECDRLGLPILSPHGLRHLHASLLLDKGVPVTAVSARLGHANPQITMKIYAHALPGQDRFAAEAIGKAISRNEGTKEV